ncbi:CocE/NonD family hydrolase [Nocardia pseudobrasiliensis]|uniref:Xaa-Pro dipeptidyl-peptidase C-terminal domain-containing protein n=1 Tax=Nocardia pseudobrasiliensis TaxID=45979 RepID=A0A370IDQ8_9NOCA|nr:CocE/NonD family hydrolase [Nocardia pseudobrasiliensis]RDI68847.1 hypothetical protein DFR76_101383 [Nocardia pseudobrasiliensis]
MAGRLIPALVLGVAVAMATLFVAPTARADDHALPVDGGAPGRAWLAEHDSPAPAYPGRFPGDVDVQFDVPITMSDGTVLKANIYRPMDATGHPITTPLPTIVNLTPYTKFVSFLADVALSVPWLSDAMVELVNRFDFGGTPFDSITDITKALSGGAARTLGADRKIIQQGYTYVVADTRGTGYSQGDWKFFQDRENRDSVEVIDWAAHQPWSDGNIGMTGISYSGINQFKTAELNPPALKAIFPVEGSLDPIGDVAFPGGTLGAFGPAYIVGIDLISNFPDPIGIALGHLDLKWLADRVDTPLEFFDLILAALSLNVASLPQPLKDALAKDSSIRNALTDYHPENIRVPTFAYGGWQDLFASSNARGFQSLTALGSDRKKLVMGDTYHANPGAHLGEPGAPPRLDVLQLAWYDHWLKGIDNGIDAYGPVVSKSQNGGWRVLDNYPDQPDIDYRRMYLSGGHTGTATSVYDGSLVPDPTSETTGFTVSPATGATALCSRDSAVESAGALSVFNFCARDDRFHELGGLTFTTAPLTEQTRLSGTANLHLLTSYDNVEGDWAVTVNDVFPNGQSMVLASGQLAASLRAVDEDKSTRAENGDLTHTVYKLTLDTRQPLVPGQPTVVDIAVNPVDAVLEPGHRLRVNVYASNFPRGFLAPPMLFDGGVLNALSAQHILLDGNEPSFVNLPLNRPLP